MDTLTKDSLLSLINQSLSGREISNILNCSWTKIRYFAYKNNIDLSTVEYNKKYNVLTKENYNEIVDLYNNQAISLTKTADMYHMDRKQLSRDLKERGIVIRKDGKKPIDGDGCIYKVNETNRYCISIVSASKNFVDDYYNFFKNNLNIIFLIESKKTKNGHLYSLRLNKQSEVKKFLSYIYNNSTEDIRLTRKYEKAKNLL